MSHLDVLINLNSFVDAHINSCYLVVPFEESHSKFKELISAPFDDIFFLFTSFDPYPHPGGLHGSGSWKP